MPPALFAGVSGSSLAALQLSPDAKRLALLFEPPTKGSTAAPPSHPQLIPGVLVYDIEADETLVLGSLPMLPMPSLSCLLFSPLHTCTLFPPQDTRAVACRPTRLLLRPALRAVDLLGQHHPWAARVRERARGAFQHLPRRPPHCHALQPRGGGARGGGGVRCRTPHARVPPPASRQWRGAGAAGPPLRVG